MSLKHWIIAGIAMLASVPLSALEPVTLQLKWKHQFQFAGYYAALEKGYYRDVGLDVTIKEVNRTKQMADIVLDGEAAFGISDSSLILQRLEGKPVVVLSTIFQRSPLVLMVKADSGIRTPYDLIGKRVMSRRNYDDASLTAMFTSLGIQRDQFEHVPQTFDDYVLQKDIVDAVSVYSTNQPFLYKELGIDIHLIDPANYGIDFYGDLIFTTEKYIKDNPLKAEGFLMASLEGWRYALDNPEEISKLIKEKYNPDLDLNKLLHEATATAKLINKNIIPIGTTHRGRFQRIAQVYRDLGLAANNSALSGILYADYQQTDKPISKEVLYTTGIITFLTLATLLTLLLFNRQLRRAVREKTHKLQIEQDKAVRASAAKSAFLANMSHEIRTPMNGIYGALQLLRNEKISPNAIGLVETAVSSTKNLLTILNDVLDISKIEENRLQIEMINFDLPNLFNEVLQNFKPNLEEKGNRLTIEISDLPTPYWQGDPTRIRQILSNLLSNANKFTENGTITAKMAATSTGVEISIQDTGIGMSEDFLKTIHQRFSQADTSTTRLYGGSGLGMSIVSSLINMMQGKLSISSTEGVGSEFTVSLPLPTGVAPTAPSKTDPNEKGSSPALKLAGKKILVAEDIAINQVLIKKIFANSGVELRIVDNGALAVNAVADFAPDLILMDIQMPIMDGITAAAAIAKTHPDIPILALTADVMDNQTDSYQNGHFAGWVAKPIEIEDLFAKIRTAITQAKNEGTP